MASGFNNTVCTFYELISGDDTQNEGKLLSFRTMVYKHTFSQVHDITTLLFRVPWHRRVVTDEGTEGIGESAKSRDHFFGRRQQWSEVFLMNNTCLFLTKP